MDHSSNDGISVHLILEDGFIEYARKDNSFLVPFETYYTVVVNNPLIYDLKGRLIVQNNVNKFSISPNCSRIYPHFYHQESLDVKLTLWYELLRSSMTMYEQDGAIRKVIETIETPLGFTIKGYHLTHNKHCGRLRGREIPFNLLTPGCKDCDAILKDRYNKGTNV